MTDYRTMSNDVFDQILTDKVDALSGAELLAIPGIYEILSEHFNNDVLETWENTLEYVHINIIPHWRSGKTWQAEMSGILPSFDDEGDAVGDLEDNYAAVVELSSRTLPAGVVDIRDDVEGEPDRLFACQENDGGPWIYIGISQRVRPA